MDTEAPRECGPADGRGVWLHSLTALDAQHNQLAGLPAALGNLTALTDLDLGFNQLTGLPGGLANLTSLTSLHLDDTT